MTTTQRPIHTWHFFRTGGLDQAQFRSGADIANLASLDQKLWTALSCPTQGICFDAKTLALLDSDADGRIRVPEILQAIAWLTPRLVSLDSLLAGSESLELVSINANTSEGRTLLANAKRILANLGKGASDVITLADVTDTAKIFAETCFNGDGVIPAEAAPDDATRQAIHDIIATFGPSPDRSGKPGVNQAKTDAFFAAAEAYLAWSARPASDPTILPLGDKTAAAVAALAAVRVKIEDFFTRCRLASFDPRAAMPLNRTDADFTVLADQALSDSLPAIAQFPLSQIGPERDLPLLAGLNPYWTEAIAAFRADVVTPLLGTDCASLSATQWQDVKAKLAPFEAWSAAKAGDEVASLGSERLAALLAGKAQAEISALIARDAALETENAQIAEVEKLIRYHANLVALLDNFVNMGRLYNPKTTAVFRIGTLYMDARACTLCFHVNDIGAHSAQSAASKCCLAYCTLTRSDSKETRTVCAAFTAGFAQTLWVGRNGIFYDLDGKDWDATIVKMVDNAISIREAFWDPWRKIAAMISSQVNKMLAARQTAALTNASVKVSMAGTAVDAPTEAPKKMEGAALASSVAALGIAIGLIGSAIGGLVSVISGLPLWKTALGILAVLLIVSGPSMLLGWFRLRARDLAPILNACGWAINRRLRFSLKLGRLFTTEAALPPHAERELTDPFADDHSARNLAVVLLFAFVVVAGLWFTGLLDRALPASFKRNPVTNPKAAAEAPATPTPLNPAK